MTLRIRFRDIGDDTSEVCGFTIFVDNKTDHGIYCESHLKLKLTG